MFQCQNYNFENQGPSFYFEQHTSIKEIHLADVHFKPSTNVSEDMEEGTLFEHLCVTKIIYNFGIITNQLVIIYNRYDMRLHAGFGQWHGLYMSANLAIVLTLKDVFYNWNLIIQVSHVCVLSTIWAFKSNKLSWPCKATCAV